MIQFNQVSKAVDNIELFNNISLFFPKASYTLISGSKGSGKTTLLKMIMAYEKPDSGTLMVDDMDITSLPAPRIPFLRRQIGLVETTPLMLENRTTEENIKVPVQIAGLDKAAIQKRVDESLQETGLETISDVPVQRLDDDQRRLVALARATVLRPPIVLVDTPDIELRENTGLTQTELLQKVQQGGTTVLVTTLDTQAPELIARLPGGSNALVIENGKINPHESTEHFSWE